MKSWRKLRADMVKIFPSDKITYKIKDETFIISSPMFVKEELSALSKFCDENKFWFYLYSIDKIEMEIVVKKE